jgi:23S rRNA G2445 N2-methylase RlmL
MKKHTPNLAKEVYKQLRNEPWETLWEREVPFFDRGTAEERLARVGLVRALGVVALEKATWEQRQITRRWLTELLQDPEEKIRRYAMNALPKLGAREESEQAVLELLDQAANEREVKVLSRTLDKIGGEATLEKLEALHGRQTALHQTEQKIKAQIARKEQPASIRMQAKIKDIKKLRIHLRTRRGMEGFVRDELSAHPMLSRLFKILRTSPSCVAIAANGPFTLAQLFQLRTFASVNFVLGVVPKSEKSNTKALAAVIASNLTQRLCALLSEGQARYRLQFMREKVAPSQAQAVANEAFALCPDLLNDARQAPWAIEVYPEKVGLSVELRPRVLPDPRFTYRVDDVPASTHPPLAAAMARMAGVEEDEVIWDPFCGSGLELIERGLLAKVQTLIASDIKRKATEIAALNFAAAGEISDSISVFRTDFKEYRKVTDIKANSLSLILANPPLGRRVRIDDLNALIRQFFELAAETLRPGGRLVFINPLKLDSPDPRLKLMERHLVDLGGFDCRVEKWSKS